MESLNNEIKRLIIEKGHFTKLDHPFTTKPKFSTLGTIIEISGQEPIFSFTPNDKIQDLSGFIASTINEGNNLSLNLVVILSFDKNFNETDTANGMIFKGETSGLIHNFTMGVDLG